MRKALLLILVMFAFAACDSSSQEIPEPVFTETEEVKEAEDQICDSSEELHGYDEREYFIVTHYSDKPNVIFELTAFEYRPEHWSAVFRTVKITVRDAVSNEVIQEIIPSDYIFQGNMPVSHSNYLGFFVEDMNFDSYADIRINLFLPASPNIPYVVWIWDTEIGQYVHDCALSSITTPMVDHENEIIWSPIRISGGWHATEYHRFINGVLTLIKRVETRGIFNEDGELEAYMTIHELVEGEWIMTEREQIEPPI